MLKRARAGADSGEMRLRIVVGLTLAACVGLAAAAGADPTHRADSRTRPIRLAAADAAGWLIFPELRPPGTRVSAGTRLALRHAGQPAAPASPPLDWLDRWGLTQRRLGGHSVP